jgi:hypothetical protein
VLNYIKLCLLTSFWTSGAEKRYKNRSNDLLGPKTNIRQENAAKYSADNKYSAQGSKHHKKVNLHKVFWGGSCKLQLMDTIYRQQKHKCVKH